MPTDVGFWSAPVHVAVTAVHVFCGVFWLGWMVFMFGILRPVATRVAPDRAAALQRRVRRRVRRIVFWLIPTIVATGLYNMAYHGLLDWTLLTQTGRGHRMLTKLGAAGLLFGVYYAAPFLLRASHARQADPDASHDPGDCHGNPDPLIQKVSVALHALAFASGVTAAVLGVSLGA